MGMLHIYPFFLIISFCGVHGELLDLPKLRHNQLETGNDNHNAIPIDCGNRTAAYELKTVSTSAVRKPKKTLTKENFEKYPFTALAINHWMPDAKADNAKFTFAELNYRPRNSKVTKTFHALQYDKKGKVGERALWLSQGVNEYIEIPPHPTEDEPATYVFTPDFGGCSWTITPTRMGKFRMRHVPCGKEHVFNNFSVSDKGGVTTYAMQFKEYAYIQIKGKTIESAKAFVYMHYTDGQWLLYIQQHTCSPDFGVSFSNFDRETAEIVSLQMDYPEESTYSKMIAGTKTYRIPVPNSSRTTTTTSKPVNKFLNAHWEATPIPGVAGVHRP